MSHSNSPIFPSLFIKPRHERDTYSSQPRPRYERDSTQPLFSAAAALTEEKRAGENSRALRLERKHFGSAASPAEKDLKCPPGSSSQASDQPPTSPVRCRPTSGRAIHRNWAGIQCPMKCPLQSPCLHPLRTERADHLPPLHMSHRFCSQDVLVSLP